MKRKLTLALALTAALALALAPAAFAASDINSVLSNLRVWLAGLLAALATLFLTIGGIRYLLAGGDPAALERAPRRSGRAAGSQQRRQRYVRRQRLGRRREPSGLLGHPRPDQEGDRRLVPPSRHRRT